MWKIFQNFSLVSDQNKSIYFVISLEVESIILLLNARSLWAFSVGVFSHLLASLILASVVAGLLKLLYKREYIPTLLLSLGIFFFFGHLAVFVGALFLLIYPKVGKVHNPTKEIEYNIIYSMDPFAEKRILTEGAIGFLKDQSIGSVLYFMKCCNPLVVNFFKNLLHSDKDELRLLANSYLKNLEQNLQDKISQLLAYSNNGSKLGGLQEFFIKKNLSMLYWEFYYLGLVEEEIRKKYLHQAKTYGEQALNIKRDPTLLFKIGRMELILGNYKKAYQYFRESIEKGIDKGIVLPYIIESLYKDKNFKELRKVLKESKGTYTLHPKTLSILKAWV